MPGPWMLRLNMTSGRVSEGFPGASVSARRLPAAGQSGREGGFLPGLSAEQDIGRLLPPRWDPHRRLPSLGLDSYQTSLPAVLGPQLKKVGPGAPGLVTARASPSQCPSGCAVGSVFRRVSDMHTQTSGLPARARPEPAARLLWAAARSWKAWAFHSLGNLFTKDGRTKLTSAEFTPSDHGAHGWGHTSGLRGWPCPRAAPGLRAPGSSACAPLHPGPRHGGSCSLCGDSRTSPGRGVLEDLDQLPVTKRVT